MKILLINAFYYPNLIGGTEHVTKKISKEFVKSGNEVAIFTCDSKEKFIEEKIDGVTVYRSTGRNVGNIFEKKFCIKKYMYKLKELRNYSVIQDLEYVLDNFMPDVVHTNNMFCMSPYVWKYIHKRRIRLIHTVHDYWLMCPKATLRNRKENNCNSPSTFCIFYRAYMKKCSEYIDVAIFPSVYILNIYKNEGYFNKAELIHISNGIEYDENNVENIINEKIKKTNKVIQFMYIGNLLKSKGIENMIAAFKTIKEKNIKLEICGDGELSRYVEDQCKTDNRIIYRGRVDGDDKQNVFKQSDVLIVPSIWKEPFGMVSLEAYTYGMVVIGSNIGAIPEIVKNKVTGLTVFTENITELSEAINYFMDRNNIRAMLPNIISELKKFDISRQAQMIMMEYRSIN